MKYHNLLLGITILVLLTACKNDPPKFPDTFDLGEVQNSTYHNNYFDLTIPVPDSFQVQSQEETNQLMNLGIDAIGETNAQLKKQLVAAAVKNAYLLTAFKYPIGTDTVDFNPSIVVVAENVTQLLNVKRGEQYLAATQKLLKKAGMEYVFSDEIIQKNIDKTPFAFMEGYLDVGGMTITQHYYTRIDKGFALNIIISFLTKEDEREMNQIIDGISYGNQ